MHGPSPAIRMGFRFRHLLQNETPAIVFFYLDKHLPLCNIHRALINRTSILLRTNQPGVRTGKRRKRTKKKQRARERERAAGGESPVQYTAIICYPTLSDIYRPATTSAVSTTATRVTSLAAEPRAESRCRPLGHCCAQPSCPMQARRGRGNSRYSPPSSR